MLKIRLQRTGRKHEPTFRLVLTDSKNSTKSGKFLEILGSYDPRNKDQAVFKADRIKYWLSQGVKVTDTLHNLLINRNIIEGKKINVLPLKTPIKKEGAPEVAPVTPAASTPTPEAVTAPEVVVEETPAPEVVAEVVPEEKKEEEVVAEVAPEVQA